MTGSAAAPDIDDVVVEVWGGRLTVHVKLAGTGPPVLYLHGATGLARDPFLSDLATRRRVFAPAFPGTAGDPYAVHAVDDLSDLVLVYEEVLGGLGLAGVTAIGQGFGGMLAAELAAYFPALVRELVLLNPLGLWRDDAPVCNWMAMPAEEIPRLLFHDPASAAARSAQQMPDDPAAARAAMVRRIWATGCSAKFLWPVPDRGLRRRLHRITARTLLVWGREDRIVPVVYAGEFAALIPNSRVAVVDECGHLPQIEQSVRTMSIVEEFLE